MFYPAYQTLFHVDLLGFPRFHLCFARVWIAHRDSSSDFLQYFLLGALERAISSEALGFHPLLLPRFRIFPCSVPSPPRVLLHMIFPRHTLVLPGSLMFHAPRSRFQSGDGYRWLA